MKTDLLPIEELSRQARAQGHFVIPCHEFTELVGWVRRAVNRKISKARHNNKPLSKMGAQGQAIMQKHRDRVRAIHWPKEKART